MKPLHLNTPLIESMILGERVNGRIWLKLDALQPSGSYKTRGVGHACATYVERGARRLLASSGGNAGLAVAYAGRQLGVPVTVVVPKTTSPLSIKAIQRERATVVIHGANWNEAHEHALELADGRAAYIHPFDDPLIWDGHATLIDEVAQTAVRPDIILLSVGGGGLLCGVVRGLQRNDWGDVPILAVETDGAASLHAAMQQGKNVGIPAITSIASTLGAKRVADQAFAFAQTHPVITHVVDDKTAVLACLDFLRDHRLLVEPACGASLTAVYDPHPTLADKQNILVIVCGGVGVTVDKLHQWRESLPDSPRP